MLKVFIEGSKTGEKVTWEQIQEAANRIQNLKAAYVDAQNAMDMQFLKDMDNALRNASTGADILQGKIDALSRTLEILSENAQGNTMIFKALANEIQNLQYTQEALDLLSTAFSDLFKGLILEGKSLDEILKGIFNNIISHILDMIAQLIATRLIMAALGGLGIGAIGAGLQAGQIVAPFIGLGGFAKGGIVPEGYPNDSFPARLTSGEAIIPLNQLEKYDFGQTVTLDADVRFEIEGDKLVAIIKKQGKRNSLY